MRTPHILPWMRVMKFGGTSVGNAESIQAVCAIVRSALKARPVVVVSAVAGVTNALIKLAKTTSATERVRAQKGIRRTHEKILKDLRLDPTLLENEFNELADLSKKTKKQDKKTLDHFVSFGERLSAQIVGAALQKMGVTSEALPAWEIGMITNDEFGDATPLPASPALIKKKISALKVVPVVTGYIGKTRKGRITTLGRGGSDYTAAIIGAAIHAEVIQIWKEVDGFMTTDPRLVPEARIVPELAFEEASELAYFGAKVLHPRTMLPAMKAGVPVQILNTFNPKEKGTMIVSNFNERKKSSRVIDALTYRKNITVIHIYSPMFFDGNKIIADIFDLFGDYNVNIGDIALSVASVSLVMDSNEPLPRQVRSGLQKMGEVTIDTRKAAICVVGGSINTAGVAGRMFSVLEKNRIHVEMIAQASAGYSITFLVKKKDAEKAVKMLHKAYISV